MAKIQAVIVDFDGTIRHTEIEHSLESFQAVVGGYIEAVIGEWGTVYVDEEGLLKRLPINEFATLYARRFLNRPVELFGTALILGPPDSQGNDTPVQPGTADYFTKEN